MYEKDKRTPSRIWSKLVQILIIVVLIVVLVFALVPRFLVDLDPQVFSSEPALDMNFSSLNSQFVNYDLWLNEERESAGIQRYTDLPENIRVDNGALLLQAHFSNDMYTSARIYTQDIFSFQYGRLVVVAQLPEGAGTWPAIWLRSEERPYGEIDIMEGQGARDGLVFSNIHLSQEDIPQEMNGYSGQFEVDGLYDTYHEFGVDWTPDYIHFTVDGEVYNTINREDVNGGDWPFDRQYHLVINFALGGKWAEGLSDRIGLGFANGIDNSMEEDWNFSIRRITYYPYLGE